MSKWMEMVGKRQEWEQMVAIRKLNGSMSKFDDEFSCPHCDETLNYDNYMDSEGGGYCPFCSTEI